MADAYDLDIDLQPLLKYEALSLGRVVMQEDVQFAIPFNQRPWVWTEPQLRDLWCDLVNTTEDYYAWDAVSKDFKPRVPPNGEPHFFGAMVCFGADNAPSQEVVDGQQRLTAVSMVAANLRELVVEVETATSDAAIRAEATPLARGLSAWLDAGVVSGVFKPRLQLDALYQDLFEAYVAKASIQPDRDTALAALGIDLTQRPNHKRLISSFNTIRDLVRADFAGKPEREVISYARVLNYTLRQAFVLLYLRVTEEPFALSVFQRLNARGKPLTEADKLKSELFDRSSPADYALIKSSWDAILQTVPNEDMAAFLRLRHVAFHGPIQASRLYETIRQEELLHQPIQTVLKRWQEDAEWLSRLTLGQPYGAIKARTRERLEDIARLRATYAWPLLLSAARRYLPAAAQDFDAAARLALNFTFRVLTIGRNDVAVLEQGIGEAARALDGGASLLDVAAALRAKNSDAEFAAAFESFSTNLAAVQFYILYELERARSGAAGLAPWKQGPAQHIEHIMPRRPSKNSTRLTEWSFAREPADPTVYTEEHAHYVNRIGNLLILEADINREVSNYAFAGKRNRLYPPAALTVGGAPRKCYADSALALVADVCDSTAYPDWTPTSIDKRQTALATEATAVWSLNA